MSVSLFLLEGLHSSNLSEREYVKFINDSQYRYIAGNESILYIQRLAKVF